MNRVPQPAPGRRHSRVRHLAQPADHDPIPHRPPAAPPSCHVDSPTPIRREQTDVQSRDRPWQMPGWCTGPDTSCHVRSARKAARAFSAPGSAAPAAPSPHLKHSLRRRESRSHAASRRLSAFATGQAGVPMPSGCDGVTSRNAGGRSPTPADRSGRGLEPTPDRRGGPRLHPRSRPTSDVRPAAPSSVSNRSRARRDREACRRVPPDGSSNPGSFRHDAYESVRETEPHRRLPRDSAARTASLPYAPRHESASRSAPPPPARPTAPRNAASHGACPKSHWQPYRADSPPRRFGTTPAPYTSVRGRHSGPDERSVHRTLRRESRQGTRTPTPPPAQLTASYPTSHIPITLVNLKRLPQESTNNQRRVGVPFEGLSAFPCGPAEKGTPTQSVKSHKTAYPTTLTQAIPTEQAPPRPVRHDRRRHTAPLESRSEGGSVNRC